MAFNLEYLLKINLRATFQFPTVNGRQSLEIYVTMQVIYEVCVFKAGNRKHQRIHNKLWPKVRKTDLICWRMTHEYCIRITRQSMKRFLANQLLPVHKYPAYPPNLAPREIYLFPEVKSTLKGAHSQYEEEVKPKRQNYWKRWQVMMIALNNTRHIWRGRKASSNFVINPIFSQQSRYLIIKSHMLTIDIRWWSNGAINLDMEDNPTDEQNNLLSAISLQHLISYQQHILTVKGVLILSLRIRIQTPVYVSGSMQNLRRWKNVNLNFQQEGLFFDCQNFLYVNFQKRSLNMNIAE